jgi:hypothetical protein
MTSAIDRMSKIVLRGRSMYNEYRSYRIKVGRTEKLTATVWAPGEFRALDIRPTATLAEGEIVLIDRARAAIDAEIAKSLPGAHFRSASRRR